MEREEGGGGAAIREINKSGRGGGRQTLVHCWCGSEQGGGQKVALSPNSSPPLPLIAHTAQQPVFGRGPSTFPRPRKHPPPSPLQEGAAPLLEAGSRNSVRHSSTFNSTSLPPDEIGGGGWQKVGDKGGKTGGQGLGRPLGQKGSTRRGGNPPPPAKGGICRRDNGGGRGVSPQKSTLYEAGKKPVPRWRLEPKARLVWGWPLCPAERCLAYQFTFPPHVHFSTPRLGTTEQGENKFVSLSRERSTNDPPRGRKVYRYAKAKGYVWKRELTAHLHSPTLM